MMGENYPEKELLKNDLEVTLQGSGAGMFVPFRIAGFPEEDKMGSRSGRVEAR